MEDAVLERLSVRQFIGTLAGEELACVLGLYQGYPQNEIAEAFGMSPASMNRLVRKIRQKYISWNN